MRTGVGTTTIHDVFDGGTYEYQYSVNADDGTWHDEYEKGDHFRRERLVTPEDTGDWGTIIQLVPLKEVDYSDGDNGVTIYEVYEYSIDGKTEWHSDYEDADIYRRTGVVVAGELSEWSEASKITGLDGKQSAPVMLFQLSATIPDLPNGDVVYTFATGSVSGSTNGWTTAVPANTEEGGSVWRTQNTALGLASDLTDVLSVGDWSTPEIFVQNGSNGLKGDKGIPGVDGEDGVSTYFHIAYADDINGGGFSQDDYTKEFAGTYVDHVAQDSTDPSDYDWHKSVGIDGEDGDQGLPGSNGSDGKTSYLHVAYADTATGSGFSQSPTGKEYIGTYVDFTPTDSTNASLYTWALIKGADGDKGENGTNGSNGNHGNGSFLYEVPSLASIPNDAGKDAHVATLAGRPAQNGDILTYQGNATVAEDDQFTRQYLRSSGSWTEFTFAVNGSAVINGTLAAEKLVAGTITGDQLNATQRFYVGDTSGAYSHMSGVSTDTAFAAGKSDIDEDGQDAPFRVTHQGKLIAENADINGKVTATSGTFTGTVNASSGVFSGNVVVGAASGTNHSFIDGGTSPYAAYFGNGNCWIKKNGDFYAKNGTFEGEILAEKITGDVVSTVSKSSPRQVVNSYATNGTSDNFVSFSVLHARSYTRTLEFAVLLNITGAGSATDIRGIAEVTGDYGEFRSAQYPIGQSQLAILSIPIPANTTGTLHTKARITLANAPTGGMSISSINSANTTTAHLYADGDDLA